MSRLTEWYDHKWYIFAKIKKIEESLKHALRVTFQWCPRNSIMFVDVQLRSFPKATYRHFSIKYQPALILNWNEMPTQPYCPPTKSMAIFESNPLPNTNFIKSTFTYIIQNLYTGSSSSTDPWTIRQNCSHFILECASVLLAKFHIRRRAYENIWFSW